jgi:hypothetical protein
MLELISTYASRVVINSNNKCRERSPINGVLLAVVGYTATADILCQIVHDFRVINDDKPGASFSEVWMTVRRRVRGPNPDGML